MEDNNAELVANLGPIMNHPDYKLMQKFFEAEHDRLVEELITNNRPEQHLEIRAKVLVFKRLKNLRTELNGLIQKL